jgi:hypothetical protein
VTTLDRFTPNNGAIADMDSASAHVENSDPCQIRVANPVAASWQQAATSPLDKFAAAFEAKRFSIN